MCYVLNNYYHNISFSFEILEVTVFDQLLIPAPKREKSVTEIWRPNRDDEDDD